MSTTQKSLRIPKELIREIDLIAKTAKKDFTTVTNELLQEALKAHHCPGIIFSEGTSGKRARAAGTGIDVWEIIATYQSVNNDFNRLKKTYNWLTIQQLRAAIGYYNLYQEEIDNLISENAGWTSDEIAKKYPFLPR